MGRRILMAVDGTERGLESVSIMGSLLKDRSDLDLVLFHCMQQLASLFPGELCLDVEKQCRISLKDMEKMGAAVLDESLSRLTAAGFPKENAKVKLKMNSMDPAQDIIAEAENQKIRTIALGRRGRSQVQAL